MTRHVYPTDRIAHLWAHQTQESARNPQGNLYFEGKVLYSYRNSYPIGNLVPMKSKPSVVGLVLIQQDRYGNTTSRHISRALVAVNHMRSIEVPYVLVSHDKTSDHTGNLKWFHDQIQETKDKAMRARTSVEWHLSKLESLIDNANVYCNFFRIRHKFQNGLTIENMAEMRVQAKDAAKAKQIKDAADNKRRAAQQERADVIARPFAQGRLDAWRAGGNRPSNEDVRVLGMSREKNGDLLRVNGDVVETSQGVKFPVSHARLGLELVRRVMSSGHDWYTNGHTLHLGHYKIDRILAADGTVYAGCHIVKWAEIERIARQLEAV